MPPDDTIIADEIQLVVVGAHMSGMPLNHQLTTLGARLVRRTATAASYNLFALADTDPAKPGLLRVGRDCGGKIEVEVWALAPGPFAAFVSAIPSPLGIGTIMLSDGTFAQGFLVESIAIEAAENITRFGGWRQFIAHRSAGVQASTG